MGSGRLIEVGAKGLGGKKKQGRGQAEEDGGGGEEVGGREGRGRGRQKE